MMKYKVGDKVRIRKDLTVDDNYDDNYDTLQQDFQYYHVVHHILWYVKYDVVYPNGEKHFQYYTGIPIDDIADLQISIVPESSYMVFFE